MSKHSAGYFGQLLEKKNTCSCNRIILLKNLHKKISLKIKFTLTILAHLFQTQSKEIISAKIICFHINTYISYFYIEKWTFKIMCEVCYRAKRDKKEAT